MAQRWDDWRDYATLQERMNRLFEDAARRQEPGAGKGEDELERAEWTPASDVYETEREFVVELDLPGIDRAALDVSLNDNKLTVRGERPAPPDLPARRAQNRPFGRFLSKFGPLPQNVDQKSIAAEYKDGVLRLRLPKRAEQKKGRIKINVS
ncbi:MAG TPA: Hsp20/alpha crystallin family protein [Pyrinomonadaceae bacterium]|jgi:HSP20 family protein